MSLTVSRDVILVGLGCFECGCTSEELVRPLGFVRAVDNLVVGLSLIGVVCDVSVEELIAYLEIVSLSNQPMMNTLKRKIKIYKSFNCRGQQ